MKIDKRQKNEINYIVSSSRRSKAVTIQFEWRTEISKWVKSRIRGIELVESIHLCGGIWYDQVGILDLIKQLRLDPYEIEILLWIWSEIWYRACHFLQKGRFYFTVRQSLRNITGTLLNEICKDVRVELQLQQLTGETLQ